MKYSVLLPTRNGGPFLDNCIRSILEQGCSDMELIISDNANVDETPNVIQRYVDDPRVKLSRVENVLSVTDNWNNALRLATGDYLLMMGDDDYLLPGYFDAMGELIDRHGEPDCILYNGFSYVAPRSIDNNPESYYGRNHFNYEPGLAFEQELDSDLRHSIVRDMFRLKVRIPLNMQTTLVKRSAAKLVTGGLFQPPFPDHYALNVLLLQAAKWVFAPTRHVVVGVSPKSFGHYVYSNQQGGGMAYLGIKTAFPGYLPGNEMLNGMHVWLNMLLASHRGDLPGISIDRGAYVRRQVYAWYLQVKLGSCTIGEALRRFTLLGLKDWGGLLASFFDSASWSRLARILRNPSADNVETQWHGLEVVPGIKDIREFAEWTQRQKSALE